jgi:hypothetical protein
MTALEPKHALILTQQQLWYAQLETAWRIAVLGFHRKSVTSGCSMFLGVRRSLGFLRLELGLSQGRARDFRKPHLHAKYQYVSWVSRKNVLHVTILLGISYYIPTPVPY